MDWEKDTNRAWPMEAEHIYYPLRIIVGDGEDAPRAAWQCGLCADWSIESNGSMARERGATHLVRKHTDDWGDLS